MSKELRWEADLVDLLKYSKPSVRPDGTSLSVQEYLDRESAWNLIVLYREGSGAAGNGFLAAGIEINGGSSGSPILKCRTEKLMG